MTATDALPITDIRIATAKKTSLYRAPAIAFVSLLLALTSFVVVVTALGSSKDGALSISIKLSDIPETGSGGLHLQTQNTRMANGHLVADIALLEHGPGGSLPIIGHDGRKPMNAYAALFDAKDKRPRIALVVRGLGVGAMATGAVLSELPPGVTLAFNPYVENVQRFVDQARGAGHEVLVELPMEPFDFPDSDPGPRTMLVAAGVEENSSRLYWAMSRFTGYVGATNFQGGKFLGEAPALEPVLGALSQRGLLFFDNGASPRSTSGQIASQKDLAYATGAFAIDGVQSADAIDAKLAELEIRAQEGGSVTASASPYPITIERIAAWAASLSGRGFVLAPITAVVKSSQAPIVKASAE